LRSGANQGDAFYRPAGRRKPSGCLDTVSRTVAEFVPGRAGQPVVVENKPGGGGVVTAATIAKAA